MPMVEQTIAERVETGVVLGADHRTDDDSDDRTGADADRQAFGRFVGRRQSDTDRREDSGADERADHPGEESRTRAERDVVAVEHDAEECTDHAEGDWRLKASNVPGLVEEQVGADPQPCAAEHGDDDGDHRRTDLVLGDEQAESAMITTAPMAICLTKPASRRPFVRRSTRIVSSAINPRATIAAEIGSESR